MPEFIAAVTCIDGRFHRPLEAWARRHLEARYVDLVTAPGVSASLAAGDDATLGDIGARLAPSLQVHRSTTVVVAAHAGCAGDPSTPAQQRAALPDAAARLHDHLGGQPSVIGVYVHADGRVEPVVDLAGTADARGDLARR